MNFALFRYSVFFLLHSPLLSDNLERNDEIVEVG